MILPTFLERKFADIAVTIHVIIRKSDEAVSKTILLTKLI